MFTSGLPLIQVLEFNYCVKESNVKVKNGKVSRLLAILVFAKLFIWRLHQTCSLPPKMVYNA